MRAVTAAAVLLPSIGGATQTTKPYVYVFAHERREHE
jgi:hypothetical protein